jgi:GTPase Era involved in 16S rRNA processing
MAAGCDLLLLIVDAHRQLAKSDPRVLRLIAEYGSGKAPAGLSGAPWSPPPSILVLNKVDMLHRDQRPALLGLADRLAALHKFEEIFWVSALRGESSAR